MHAHPDFASKRQLGAYYTPGELSDILANYLITSPTEILLEPSFGGGGILASAQARLKELGCVEPERQLYGCDIDSYAFQNLCKVVKNKFANQPTRFIKDDFLKITTDRFYRNYFDLVIANPPYIGYGQMTEPQRELGKQLQKRFGLKGSKASTWYFFLLKSLLFLKEEGKIAFVLPYAFIDSAYSESLRKFIGDRFKHSAAYVFSNKIFADQGTNERVLVLIAEGWSPNESLGHSLQAIQVDNFSDFVTKLYTFQEKGNFGKRFLGSKIGRVKGKLSNADISLINTYMESPYISKLGTHLNVRIGLVAGDAKFFTLSKEKAIRAGLYSGEYLIPLMRSLRSHNGLNFGVRHFRNSEHNNDQCYLLNYSEDLLDHESYRNYINSYNFSTISDNKTFNKRNIWCQVSDNRIPDFFIPCMSIDGPRLILNTYKANCLNNSHRGFLVKDKISVAEKKLISLSMLTNFTQLITEMEAKLYGSDALKLEPSLYERLPIFMPDITLCGDVNDYFKTVSKIMENERFDDAIAMASAYIYGKIFGPAMAEELVVSFGRVLEMIRKYRIRK